MIDRPDWSPPAVVVDDFARDHPSADVALPMRGDWGDGQTQNLPAAPTATDTEIAEIEKAMRTDRRAYDRDEQKQARYRSLIAKKLGLDEGEEVVAIAAVAEIQHELDKLGTRQAFEGVFDILPEPVITAIGSELMFAAVDIDPRWKRAYERATPEALQLFATVPHQAELVREWGSSAAQKLGRLKGRAWAIHARLHDAGREADFDEMLGWFDRVPAAEQKIVLRALAR